MITIQNGKFNIPEEERFIGFAGDNLRKKIEFLVKDRATVSDIYRIYLTFDDRTVNYFVLPSTETAEGVLLTWNILEGHIFRSGIVRVQIKAFSDDGVIWHTNQDSLIVGKTAEFPDSAYKMKNTEFLEYEKTLNVLRDEVRLERTKLPYIGENGNWFCYDVETDTYSDSGKPSVGIAETFEITDGYITEKMLSEKSVSKEKLAEKAVTCEKIADKAVKPEKLDRRYWSYKSINPVYGFDYLNFILDDDDNTIVTRLSLAGLSPVRAILGDGDFVALNSESQVNVLYIINLKNGDFWKYTRDSETLTKELIGEDSIAQSAVNEAHIKPQAISQKHIKKSTISDTSVFSDEFINTYLTSPKSAYEIAVDNGFAGNEREWLASLTGTVPLFANSSVECTDITKLYVLPDGYIYAYMHKSIYPEITIESKSNGYWIVMNNKLQWAESAGLYAKKTNEIPVTPGDKLSYRGRAEYYVFSAVYYDAGKSIVGTEQYYNESEATVFTVPENASSVVFTSYGYDAETGAVLDVQFIQCSGASSEGWVSTGHAFVPADYEDRIVALERNINTSSGPLKGKKIIYDGDSICADHDNNGGAYPKLIANKVGCSFVNHAEGGARLVTLSGGESYHSIVDNLENLPKDGDLYCFEGGINDYWNNGNLGDYDLTDFTGELDKTTVCGALETIFRYCLDNFVGKPICFVIAHKCQNTAYANNSQGNSFASYREKIIGICEKYSIPYYDAFKESGLNGWNTAQNKAFLTANSDGTPDGCHPNSQGYKRYYVPQLISLFESIVPTE